MIRTIIIDDDEIVTFLQKKHVVKSELDSDPYVFKNPQQALQFLRSNMDHTVEYLIMLDINMPQMTGWDFLEQLNYIPHNDQCHVVMVTSSIDRRDKRMAADDPHVVDFIEKPVSARHYAKLKGITRLSTYFQEASS